MNSKSSMMKSIVLTAALAAAVSGLARADDSSMNLFAGDSYAYFNGGKNFPYGKPALDYAPSGYRPAPPQDALAFQREHFPFVNSADREATPTARAISPPHDKLPSIYGEATAAKDAVK